jgi:MHS family proline/betaine transporter-like MFS transporter
VRLVTVGPPAIEREHTVRRATLAAAVGNVAEWYDFGIYSYLAAVALDRVFFPDAGPWAPVFTLGTFAAAFLVRPLGGLVFGPLGDRIGRTRVLAATVLIMALATVSLGLVPGYATIGVAAPLIVLVIRMLQGFSVGGEYTGALTLVAEYAPDRRRGFFGSWLEFGTLVGYTLGAGTSAVLVAVLSEDDLLSWGWRLPFMLALPLGLTGIFLRLRLEETPAFRQLVERSPAISTMSPRRAFQILVRRYRRAAVVAGGLVVAWNVTNYVLTNYVPTYLTRTLPDSGVSGTSEAVTTSMQVAVMLLMLCLILGLGRLSDRIGRKPVLFTGSATLVVLGLPSVWLLRQGPAGQVAGLLVMGGALLCFAAVAPSTLPALFPTLIRYGSLAIIFNVAVSAVAGTAPTAISAAVAVTGNLDWPGYYLVGAGVVGLVSTWFLREPAGRALAGAAPLQSSADLPAPVLSPDGVPLENPAPSGP